LSTGNEVRCWDTEGAKLGTSEEDKYYTVLIHLSETENAHVEESLYSDFPYAINISSNESWIECSYKEECGDYACVASIDNETNAHIDKCSVFAIKICCGAVDHPLANFLEQKIFMTVGTTYHLVIHVRNIKPVPDTINISLHGEYPEGLAKFLNSSSIKGVSGDARNISVYLNPYEIRNAYIEIISTDVGEYSLGLLAESVAEPSLEDSDETSITIGFPASFPGMETFSIAALLLMSGILYWKKIRKGY
jgi:hypothetical protein